MDDSFFLRGGGCNANELRHQRIPQLVKNINESVVNTWPIFAH